MKEQTKETEAFKSKDDDDRDSNCGSLVLDTSCTAQPFIFPTDTELLKPMRKPSLIQSAKKTSMEKATYLPSDHQERLFTHCPS